MFYIADDKCPRCKGLDPAVLFAGEVNLINKHLEEKGARLWIWGDRLLDGSVTGMGMWEASMNNTEKAIDLISKSVVICDWHYEKAIPTPAYFALKGFDVIACPWRKPKVAESQVQMMADFKHNSGSVLAFIQPSLDADAHAFVQLTPKIGHHPSNSPLPATKP